MHRKYELCLRLSSEEQAQLECDARRCGLSKTAYLRRLILGAEIKARPTQEIKNLRTEIHHIGNNINQIARSVNADGALNWNCAYYGCDGLRPACYLDSDLLISVEDDEATDDVTPEHAGEIIAALAEQFGGTFATEDQLTTALSFMLGTLRATREKEARHE